MSDYQLGPALKKNPPSLCMSVTEYTLTIPTHFQKRERQRDRDRDSESELHYLLLLVLVLDYY